MTAIPVTLIRVFLDIWPLEILFHFESFDSDGLLSQCVYDQDSQTFVPSSVVFDALDSGDLLTWNVFESFRLYRTLSGFQPDPDSDVFYDSFRQAADSVLLPFGYRLGAYDPFSGSFSLAPWRVL